MTDVTDRFVPGLELCEAFHREIVVPILRRRFPDLVYSAAKLGAGSDVLGFDTPRSMDHDWGPTRFDLFLREEDFESHSVEIHDVLANELPPEFRGLPTNFMGSASATGSMGRGNGGPISHRIVCTTTGRFFRGYVGFDPREPVEHADWLLVAPQRLRTVASGAVFHDGLGELGPVRDALRWYPRDVWIYLLASQWGRIDQEEPFMARSGDVGDELGSRVVAGRMVEELMKLAFLMERVYWPYPKWFGTAFSKLSCASLLAPIFHAVLDAGDWKEREGHLSSAYAVVLGMHNDLGLTESVETRVTPFHDRPYLVPHAERVAVVLRELIDAPDVRASVRVTLGLFLLPVQAASWPST